MDSNDRARIAKGHASWCRCYRCQETILIADRRAAALADLAARRKAEAEAAFHAATGEGRR